MKEKWLKIRKDVIKSINKIFPPDVPDTTPQFQVKSDHPSNKEKEKLEGKAKKVLFVARKHGAIPPRNKS